MGNYADKYPRLRFKNSRGDNTLVGDLVLEFKKSYNSLNDFEVDVKISCLGCDYEFGPHQIRIGDTLTLTGCKIILEGIKVD